MARRKSRRSAPEGRATCRGSAPGDRGFRTRQGNSYPSIRVSIGPEMDTVSMHDQGRRSARR